jgi:rubrerythrin
LAYIRNLAAAEQAVQRGQFNVAKVLRAAANAHRVLAFNAARLLEVADPQPPDALLAANRAELQPGSLPPATGAASGAAPVAVPLHGPALPTFLAQAQTVQTRVSDLLQRALDSLAAHPDILERDVAMWMHSCRVCGNPMEGRAPEQCDLCGAVAAEFLYVGPFYSWTDERLGRLSPQQVTAILAQGPEQVTALIDGVDDALLCRKPSPDEWCIKEIVAHTLEADYICVAQVQAILAQTPYAGTVPPWQTHVGKGYETRPAAALIAQYHAARRATLALLQSLAPSDWSRTSYTWGRAASILDVGMWVANHDVGHLAQVRRLLAAWQAVPS